MHITISVKDLDRATAFYRDVLGCEIIRQNPIMSFMKTGDDHFVLTQLDHHVSPNSPGEIGQETTLFHHAFFLEEAEYDAAVETFKRHGIPTWDCSDLGHNTYPDRRHLYVMDPDGNSIELVTILPSDKISRHISASS